MPYSTNLIVTLAGMLSGNAVEISQPDKKTINLEVVEMCLATLCFAGY